ncbi:hypothetical protein HMPREF1584_00112 [Gardnerella vaginalis JCP8481A]|nr:DUF3566 domain-containing protein [Gardnerella vaginalis]EPI41365.1 hypothetical protein HMPREF1585_01184 [Gardnerella vaginalis JCP8481B]EPI44814.1 hypothetical protein HMPREF1584_00112 [Gardnerella vaginalis JCP8481A]
MSENFEPSQNPMNMNEKSAMFLPHETETYAEKIVPSESADYSLKENNNADDEYHVSSLNNMTRNTSSASGRVSGNVHTSRRTIGGVASAPTSQSQKSNHIPRARRMSLSLVRVDAWSVAKVTFLLSVAGGIIQVIAAGLVWLFLNMVGVFDQVTQIVSSTGLDSNGFNLADVFSLPTVLSAVTIFSIVEIVILTILSAIIALLYNVVGSLVGGIHITLGDD